MKQNFTYQFPDGSKIPVVADLKTHHKTKKNSSQTEHIRIEWKSENKVCHTAWLPAHGLKP